MSERLAAFLAASDRYTKAPARRCLTQVMPMSPDFAKLVNLAGMIEAPRHVILERLVADGSRIVPHSEREIRGSTLHIEIGRALTIQSKAGQCWRWPTPASTGSHTRHTWARRPRSPRTRWSHDRR